VFQWWSGGSTPPSRTMKPQILRDLRFLGL